MFLSCRTYFLSTSYLSGLPRICCDPHISQCYVVTCVQTSLCRFLFIQMVLSFFSTSDCCSVSVGRTVYFSHLYRNPLHPNVLTNLFLLVIPRYFFFNNLFSKTARCNSPDFVINARIMVVTAQQIYQLYEYQFSRF